MGSFVCGCQGWTCFRVEQLEARLLSLDSRCVVWLNEAARREERLCKELLTCRLNEDISQVTSQANSSSFVSNSCLIQSGEGSAVNHDVSTPL